VKPPLVAVILVYPSRAGVTAPVLFTVATVEFELLHVAVVETSTVLESVNVTSADSCVVAAAPRMMLGAAGEITKPVACAGPTTKEVLPLMAAELAEMVTEPCLSVVAKPVALTVASVVSELDQVTEVSGFDVPSEKPPVAVNCKVRPAATVLVCGDTEIVCSVAAGVGVGVGGAGVPVLLPPPQPLAITRTSKATRQKSHFEFITFAPRKL